MTISGDLEAKILRYHHVEKWRVGTIARQLEIHHSSVTRVLQKSGVQKVPSIKRESLITPYMSFIMEILKKYPTLTASRLYDMVCQRGYKGGVDHFRYLISLYRPRPETEAYLRLRTLPGEQAQVDWGHFGHVEIGNAKRPLMAFVMVLSYSRKVFLRFSLDARMSNFLFGHEAAFLAWNGIPRVLLYDNLKSAVLERRGDAIRFNPTLLEFASHYRFEPRPVAVARGNEKGRVERTIRYVRDNFFPARKWEDVDDLNRQAIEWCENNASNRPCREDTSKTVREVFLLEQPALIQLPGDVYPTHERIEIKIGKTPYARFDLNDYSVPHTHARKSVTVCATHNAISIIDGTTTVAKHQRCYDKGRQIEDPSHIEALVALKKKSRQHRGQDRLIKSIPQCSTFLIEAAKRGYNLKHVVTQLLQLLDGYGVCELEEAVACALKQGVPHPNTVRISLERQREGRDILPPIVLKFTDDKRIRDLVVRPHELKSYDQLHTEMQEE